MPPAQLGKIPLYNGAWDCAVKTVHKEGFFGLYKGIIYLIHFYLMKNTLSSLCLVLFCCKYLQILFNYLTIIFVTS